jgi:3-oxoacyl-[acyl-carrier protein] reductase
VKPESVKKSVTDMSTAKAEQIVENINKAGGSSIAVPGDILDSSYVEELIKKAAEFGSGKIHIIVNNAGYTWDGVIHKVILEAAGYIGTCSQEPDDRQAMGLDNSTP